MRGAGCRVEKEKVLKLPKTVIFVCSARLGWHKTLVYIDPTTRGANWCSGDNDDRPWMCVGVNRCWWPGVVSALLHEAFECVADARGHVLEPLGSFDTDSDGTTLLMTHAQFSWVAAKAGEFLADVLPKIQKAFNKAKKARHAQ
jgi:hypothetical protein